MSAWRLDGEDHRVCVPSGPDNDEAWAARDNNCRTVHGEYCTLVGGGDGYVVECPSAGAVASIVTYAADPEDESRESGNDESEPVYVGRLDPITITGRPPGGANRSASAETPDKPPGSTGVYTYGQEASFAVAAWQGADDAIGNGNGSDNGNGNGSDNGSDNGNGGDDDLSWASRNWPWLVGGGVVLAGLLVFGGAVAFGGSDDE